MLTRIHKLNNPSTSDLEQDDAVRDVYSESSVSRTLRRLVNDGYLEKEDGKPARYSLTKDGYQAIRDPGETTFTVQDGEDVAKEDVIEAFEEYFRIDEIEQSIAEQALYDDAVLLDYQHLEKLEPSLADVLVSQPIDVLDAAQTAVTRLSVIDEPVPVNVTNLPSYHKRQIREINTNDVDSLVTVPGIVLKASKVRPMLVKATFQCTGCGNEYTRAQNGGTPSSPYKCSCDHKHFRCIDKQFDDVRILKLQEKPDSPDKKDLLVRVRNQLANADVVTEMNPGTAVRLTGVVRTEEPSKHGEYYELYLDALDVDSEQEKWDEIELTEADKDRNREIVEYGTVEAFQESLAADRVAHRELMKEAFLLYLLGKTEQHGNLHVLVMGSPGTGKSQLSNWAEEHLPKTIKANVTTSTAVGLTATVKQDEKFGGYVAEGGSLTLADGGYHLTDEFDKIDGSDVVHFNDALQDGEIVLNKGDITNLKLNADVSEWATANPRQYDYFDPEKPKYQQIPIPPEYEATKDRFDVILAVEEYDVETDEKSDVVDHILGRGEDGFDGDEAAYSAEALIKFVTEAAAIDPVMMDDAKQVLRDAFYELKKQEGPEERFMSNRQIAGLKKLSIAYARANLSKKVTADHAASACDFLRRSLASIEFDPARDSRTDIMPAGIADKRSVRDAIEEITKDAEKDGASITDISAETGLAADRVEEVIDNNKDEFYKPVKGKWRVT